MVFGKWRNTSNSLHQRYFSGFDSKRVKDRFSSVHIDYIVALEKFNAPVSISQFSIFLQLSDFATGILICLLPEFVNFEWVCIIVLFEWVCII